MHNTNGKEGSMSVPIQWVHNSKKMGTKTNFIDLVVDIEAILSKCKKIMDMHI
jgi:hypothetical protein